MHPLKHTILILGGSGFIGNAIYHDLCGYFETYATYCSQSKRYKNNKAFYQYNCNKDDITEILNRVHPTVIISCFKGDNASVITAHKNISSFIAKNHHTKLYYISSARVFDGLYKFPKYENDQPKAQSEQGVLNLKTERLLQQNIPAQTTIIRLPLILGAQSPTIFELRKAIKFKTNFEVYPNLIVNVTTIDKVTQQLHYLINLGVDGIWHLGSSDVIHHSDLIEEICTKLNNEFPVIKNVYNRNDDSYLAILPGLNKLPFPHTITVQEVIDNSILEEIVTYRN